MEHLAVSAKHFCDILTRDGVDSAMAEAFLKWRGPKSMTRFFSPTTRAGSGVARHFERGGHKFPAYFFCRTDLKLIKKQEKLKGVQGYAPTGISVGLRQGCSLSPILFLIYMDRIVRKSKSCGGVKIGECTVQRLLFADDLMLLDSTQNGLQQALDGFSDACSVAGMKISTTKTETMCLSRQSKQCSLQIDGVPLKQSEKFK